MASDDYDVIVVGAGIGGLVCAALTSAQGMQTLVLEQGKQPGGCCSSFVVGDYLFDMGPTLFWGLEEGAAFHHILTEVGVLSDDPAETMRVLDPGLQVILPDRRVTLPRSSEALREELQRAFPKEAKSLWGFYSTAHRVNEELAARASFYPFWNYSAREGLQPGVEGERGFSRPLERMADQHRRAYEKPSKGEAVNLFFDLQTNYFSAPSVGTSLLGAVVASVPRRGICYFPGGAQALANMLEGAVRDGGGTINYSSRVEELLVRDEKVVGVRAQFESIQAEIGAPIVVLNAPLGWGLRTMVPDDAVRGRLLSSVAEVFPPVLPVSLFIGVDDSVVPDPMCEHVFMLRDGDIAAEPSNCLYVLLSPSWDTTRAPRGKRTLTVTTYVPSEVWAQVRDNQAFKRDKTEEVIVALERVIPLLESNMDFIDMATPITYERFTLRERGRLGKPFMHVDPAEARSEEFPVAGLYAVGDHAYPGHGVMSAALSAHRVAHRILSCH